MEKRWIGLFCHGRGEGVTGWKGREREGEEVWGADGTERRCAKEEGGMEKGG